MTFDAAWDAYDADPSIHNLVQLLKTAREYYAEDSIGEDTFFHVLDTVEQRLKAISRCIQED